MEIKPLRHLKEEAIKTATKQLLLEGKERPEILESPGFFVSVTLKEGYNAIGEKIQFNTPEGELSFFILQKKEQI